MSARSIPRRKHGPLKKRRLAFLLLTLALMVLPVVVGQLAYLQWARSQELIRVDAGAATPVWWDRSADLPQPLLTRYVPDSTAAVVRILALVRPTPHGQGTEQVVLRVFLQKLPADLAQTSDPEARKTVFVAIVLPLVLRENERLRALRQHFIAMQERLGAGRGLSLDDHRRLTGLYQRYDVAPGNTRLMLRRLDEVPAALAVGQAAKETGWGLSRFACEGNALFGIWTWSKNAQGMVPREREEGARHRVRAYPSLADGVRVYMHTLNTHYAYGDFRVARAHMRDLALNPDGAALATELERYSERRGHYVFNLRTLMEQNNLHPLDQARLAPAGLNSHLLQRIKGSREAEALLLAALVDRIVAPTSASAAPDPERCS